MLTFTTEPDHTTLVALDDLKDELGITGTDEDARLARYVAGVSARIARVCSRVHFGSASVVETFDRVRGSRGTFPLWLSHWPVTAIAAVVEDETTLAAAEYRLDDSRRLRRMDEDGENRSIWSPAKIVVTYTGGYDLPADCPEDLRDAAIKLVKAQWYARGRDPMVKAEDVDGILSTQYWVGEAPGGLDGMPSDVAATLINYRNI